MAQGHPSLRRVHAFFWGGVWLCAFGVRTFCLANPTGGVVTLGDAQIQNCVPGLTTIVQNTDRAVIDWQSFSIAVGEQTNFIVPDATSATLNRVLGCDASFLNGTLTSNGHLFLINSNGIIFGQGSTVDVAGLTASTLDIDNCAFMAGGEMVFKGSSEAAVKNAGVIRASTGDAFLIGYQVANSGTINAPNGTVGLAAGSEVLIKPVGDERVVVRNAVGSYKKTGVHNSGVIEANVAELKAHNGNVYALAIRNTGRVAATAVTRQGGRILLSANGGNIQSRGQLVARGTSGNGGQIKVSAGNGGRASISGRVDADGPDGAGGKVTITGEEVTIRRAVLISADGKTEGGQINVGFDPDADAGSVSASRTEIAGTVRAGSSQGVGGQIQLGGDWLALKDESVISANGATGGGSIFANSTCVTIDCGALLSANALENGNGGQVVIFAEKDLTFQGSLQARGGMITGDGGFAELSAKESLRLGRLTENVELGAQNGRAGGLLIKSGELVIADPGCWVTNPLPANTLNAEDLSSFLNTANLTLQTDQGSPGSSGNIYLKGTVAWCSAHSLTINAACDFLMINADEGLGVIDAQGGGDVTVNAARFVLLESGTAINTTSGDVVVNANQRFNSDAGQFGVTLGGGITTNGGNVSLAGEGITSTDGTVNAGSGTILVDGNDGAIHLAGALTSLNGTESAVRIIDATTTTFGDITTGAAGTVTLGEAGGDGLSGAVTQTGSIKAGSLILAGSGDFNLTGASNAVGFLATSGSVGSLSFVNSTALHVSMVGTASGLSAAGGIAVSVTGANGLLVGKDIASQGGAVSLSASSIELNGASVSSTGNAPVTLTAGKFVLVNQPFISGVLVGSGGNAQLVLDDSNLTTGQTYTIGADKLTAGSRSYSFQGVSSVSLDLGDGNDTSGTNFFTFDQFLNAGGGTNQLLVGGSPVSSSPLTRPGFGTIYFSGFELAPPPAPEPPPPVVAVENISVVVPVFGAFLLQNAVPVGEAGSGSSSQTNNFTSSSAPGGALASAGGGGAGSFTLDSPVPSGGLPGGGFLAGLTGSIGQNLGLFSAGGGAPPSFGLQSQMNATTSSVVQSELSLALGGDGTMGVRSSTGLVSVNPGGGPPSSSSLGHLAAGTSLLAQSELAIGALGMGEVTLDQRVRRAVHQSGRAAPGHRSSANHDADSEP
jgi:filamentous hemagglutinin family protein